MGFTLTIKLTEPSVRGLPSLIKKSHSFLNQSKNNRAILIISELINNFLASASEAECAAYLSNFKKNTIILQSTLEEMVHPQLATPIHVENTTYNGIINSKIQQKLSKEMDMGFYWVRDRVKQKL